MGNIVRDDKGQVFLAEGINLPQLLADNPHWASETGGHQGGPGQFNILGITIPYSAGSLGDKIAEAWSGPHDTFNKPVFYDNEGNNRSMSEAQKKVLEVVNYGNVALTSPFALSTLLSPESWNAIATVIFGK